MDLRKWIIYLNDPEQPTISLYCTLERAQYVVSQMNYWNSEDLHYTLRQMS